jgi:FkbM family methyltransferase
MTPITSVPQSDVINIEELLNDLIQGIDEEISFIQIGANDGTKNDYITKFIKSNNWQGVLVEPVSYLFEKLKSTYAGYNLNLENSAITTHNGHQTIYRLKQDEIILPAWLDGLGSLDEKIILSHSEDIPELNSLIVEEVVHTLTFSSLLEKYNIKNIHILHIDAEGHDFEIIKTIDFAVIRPDIIIYEFHHLTLYTHHKSVNYLQNKGYEVYRSHNSFDAIAVDKLIIS